MNDPQKSVQTAQDVPSGRNMSDMGTGLRYEVRSEKGPELAPSGVLHPEERVSAAKWAAIDACICDLAINPELKKFVRNKLDEARKAEAATMESCTTPSMD